MVGWWLDSGADTDSMKVRPRVYSWVNKKSTKQVERGLESLGWEVSLGIRVLEKQVKKVKKDTTVQGEEAQDEQEASTLAYNCHHGSRKPTWVQPSRRQKLKSWAVMSWSAAGVESQVLSQPPCCHAPCAETQPQNRERTHTPSTKSWQQHRYWLDAAYYS